MNRARLIWHVIAGALILPMLVWWVSDLLSTDQTQPYPNEPIQIVVPYGAGGGSDTFVRTLQKGIVEDDLLSQPLVIVNQAGGSGTIGSRDVKDADPDGYKILCLHNSLLTAKLAGTVSYGVEAFEPIAMTGELSMVVLVREDASYRNMRDLLEDAKARPKEVKFGANQGAPSYFTTLQLEREVPGADFSIVSADGGADRYAKILGKHLDAGIFSLSEYLDFRSPEGTPPERNIRAIAVLSPERHESIPEVPTSVEHGIDVLASNAHYWWAPKETPKPIIEKLANVFRKAMENQTVLTELQRLRVDPIYDQGQTLVDRLDATVKMFESTVEIKESTLPDFTKYVMGIVAVVLLWVFVEAWRGTAAEEDPPIVFGTGDFTPQPMMSAMCFAALMAYVYVLGQGWLPFAAATSLMVYVIGGLMTRWQRPHWIILGELALLTGLGTQFIFTQVFETILP